MSLTCPKCLKKMQTSQKLQAHLKRKNPCDKVCLICGKKYANQRGFNSHRKTHMQEMVQDNKAEEIIEELEQVQHLSPLRKYKAHRANFLKTKRELPLQVKWLKEAFPLEDFEVDTIVVEREETRTINNQVIFEKVTYERIVIRGRIIEELLQWGPLNAVLEALKHKSNKQEIMKQIMYQIHAQPEQPHFHSVCRTDINRDTISLFTRTTPAQEGRWIKAHFKDVLNRLNTHARKLTLFVLQAGINALEIRYWTKEKQVVFMFEANKYQTLLYRRKNMLMYERNKAVNEFVDCDQSHEGEINDLMLLLEDTKQKTMDQIRKESLNEKTFDDFFNYTRVKGITASAK